MFLPPCIGALRAHKDLPPLPDWLIRDMGDRLTAKRAARRWNLPVWPGFRLEIRIKSRKEAAHV